MIVMKLNSFSKLKELIKEFTPQGNEQFLLHLGESKLLVENTPFNFDFMDSGWNKYPSLGGTDSLRRAYLKYLNMSFNLSSDDIEQCRIEIEPTPGSKHALSTLIALSSIYKSREGRSETVLLLPDPGYPSYAAAATYSYSKVIFYSSHPDFMMTELVKLLKEHRQNLAALIVCNPGNPYGNVLSEKEILQLVSLSKGLVIFDECYVDLYHNKRSVSPLELIARGQLDIRNLMVSHTLSKRDALPGLRSGFLCGDVFWISRWAKFNRSCGVSLPDAICQASSLLWPDQIRVKKHRELISENFKIFTKYFPQIQLPNVGFFVCIPVVNDKLASQLLWREEGILVMPGSLLMHEVNLKSNFLRMALVYPETETKVISEKISNFFSRHKNLLIEGML